MNSKDIAQRERHNAEFRLKKLYEEVESSPLGGFRSADMKIAKNILKINPTKDISYADKMIFDRQKELSDNINQNYADIGFKDFRSTSAGASDIMVRSLVKSELNKGTPSSYKDFKKNFYKIASIKETDTILKNLNSLGAFKGNVRLANIPIIGKAFNPTLNNNLIDVDDERSNLLRYALGISDDINGFIDSSTAYRLNKITTGKFNPFREGKEVFGGVKSALKHRYGILYNRFEKDDKDLSRDRVIYAGYTYDNMREQLLDASANSFSTSLSMLNELNKDKQGMLGRFTSKINLLSSKFNVNDFDYWFRSTLSQQSQRNVSQEDLDSFKEIKGISDTIITELSDGRKEFVSVNSLKGKKIGDKITVKQEINNPLEKWKSEGFFGVLAKNKDFVPMYVKAKYGQDLSNKQIDELAPDVFTLSNELVTETSLWPQHISSITTVAPLVSKMQKLNGGGTMPTLNDLELLSRHNKFTLTKLMPYSFKEAFDESVSRINKVRAGSKEEIKFGLGKVSRMKNRIWKNEKELTGND
ncbi:MAG: hypothetical protein KAI91_05590, partial [Candidatus Omnitrophica bacterium]|nr:hypothetical protein [Candidatus Omnitrophota bacterium]